LNGFCSLSTHRVAGIRPKKQHVVIANTHLVTGPGMPEISLLQAQMLTYAIEEYLKSYVSVFTLSELSKSRDSKPSTLITTCIYVTSMSVDAAVILAGDLNRQPDSPLISFLQSGHYAATNIKDPAGQQVTTRDLSHSIKFASVYGSSSFGEPKFTSRGTQL
jgi:hypothetical protein